MCNPTAVVAAAGVVGIGGAIQGMNAQAGALKSEASSLRRSARSAMLVGNIEESMKRMEVQRIIGGQRAAAASSGADVGSGSIQSVVESTAILGELDAQMVRHNARLEAMGLWSAAKSKTSAANAIRKARGLTALGMALDTAATAWSMGKRK